MLLKSTRNVCELLQFVTIFLILLVTLLTPLTSGGVLRKRETETVGGTGVTVASIGSDIIHYDDEGGAAAVELELEKTLEVPKVTKLLPHAANVVRGQHEESKSSGHLILNRVEMDGSSSAGDSSEKKKLNAQRKERDEEEKEHEKEKEHEHEHEQKSGDDSHDSDSFEHETRKVSKVPQLVKSEIVENSLTADNHHVTAAQLEKSVMKLQPFMGTTKIPVNSTTSNASSNASSKRSYNSNNNLSESPESNESNNSLNEQSNNPLNNTSNNLSKYSSSNALNDLSDKPPNSQSNTELNNESNNPSGNPLYTISNNPSGRPANSMSNNASKVLLSESSNEPPINPTNSPSKSDLHYSLNSLSSSASRHPLNSKTDDLSSGPLNREINDRASNLLNSQTGDSANNPANEPTANSSNDFSNKSPNDASNDPSNKSSNDASNNQENEPRINSSNDSSNKPLNNSNKSSIITSKNQEKESSINSSNDPSNQLSKSSSNNQEYESLGNQSNDPSNKPSINSSNNQEKESKINSSNDSSDKSSINSSNNQKNESSNNQLVNSQQKLDLERPRLLRENSRTQIYGDDLQQTSTQSLDPIVIKLESPTSNPVSNNQQATDVTPIVTIDMNTNGRVEATSMSVLMTTMTTHPANFLKSTAAPIFITSSTTAAPPTIAKPRLGELDEHVDESNEIRGNSGNSVAEGREVGVGSSEKRAKFINDNSTNTQQMNLPDAAEVWTLAGMKPTIIQYHKQNFTTMEGPKSANIVSTTQRSLNNSAGNGHSEKNLLDWTQIMLHNELQAKKTPQKADDLIKTTPKSTENRTEMQINSTVDTTDAEAIDVLTTETIKNVAHMTQTVLNDKSTVSVQETDLNLKKLSEKDVGTTTEVTQLIDGRVNSQLTDTVMHDKSAVSKTNELNLQKQAAEATNFQQAHLPTAGSTINNNNTKLSSADMGVNDNETNKTQLETTGEAKEQTVSEIKSEEKITKVSDYPRNANMTLRKSAEAPENNETNMPLATTISPIKNIGSSGSGGADGGAEMLETLSNNNRKNNNNNTEAREYHANDNDESAEHDDDDVMIVKTVGTTASNNATHPHIQTHNALTEHAASSGESVAVSMLESSTVTTTKLNGTSHVTINEKLQVEENENKTQRAEISDTPTTESVKKTIKENNIGHLGNEVDDEDIKKVNIDKTHLKPEAEKVEETQTTSAVNDVNENKNIAGLLVYNTTKTREEFSKTTTTEADLATLITTTQLPLLKTPVAIGSGAESPTIKPAKEETLEKKEEEEQEVKKITATHETESSIETNIIEPAKTTTTTTTVIIENTTKSNRLAEKVDDEEGTEKVDSKQNVEIALVPNSTTMATLTVNANITTTTTIEPILPQTSEAKTTEAPMINLLDDITTVKPLITTTTTETTVKQFSTTAAPSVIATKVEDKYTVFPDTTTTESLPTSTSPTISTTTSTPHPTTMLPPTTSEPTTSTTYDPIISPEPTNILTAITGPIGRPIDAPMHPNSSDARETDVNVIIAITVSVVGVIALILLVAFLFLMRKRQKQMSYGQRCRPVSLDAYSLDNVSVLGSTRRKSASRNSKRSYGNIAFDDPSLRHNLLTAMELGKFVERRSSIFEEFRDVPQIIARPDEVPAGCEDKNRYANVIPLPETRVILQQQNNDDKTEYINANYVRGPKDTPNYYIACQAPLESTVADFWRMIWEQQSRVIIQATDLIENGIEKCAEYLPPSVTLDNHNTYGDFQVTLKNREIKDKYAISTLMLKNTTNESSRELTHYWYKWPETGVPAEEAPIIAMLLEVRSSLKSYAIEQANDMKDIKSSTQTLRVNDVDENVSPTPIQDNGGESKEATSSLTEVNGEINGNNLSKEKLRAAVRNQGPLTVHCSPGTGRTGTIIACDMAIRSLETPKRSVDIPQIVYYVRRGRASAVQTKEQYEFIYKVANMYATKITNFTHDN